MDYGSVPLKHPGTPLRIVEPEIAPSTALERRGGLAVETVRCAQFECGHQVLCPAPEVLFWLTFVLLFLMLLGKAAQDHCGPPTFTGRTVLFCSSRERRRACSMYGVYWKFGGPCGRPAPGQRQPRPHARHVHAEMGLFRKPCAVPFSGMGGKTQLAIHCVGFNAKPNAIPRLVQTGRIETCVEVYLQPGCYGVR